MQLENVKLIYVREMRDQLRDRRTLFMIAVLPLLLYPLLGHELFSALAVLAEDRAEGAGRRRASSSTATDWLPPLIEGQALCSEAVRSTRAARADRA